MRIMNTTIVGLSAENYKGDFIGDMLTNVNFKEGNLSKIPFNNVLTGNGYIKFEDSILPKSMAKSVLTKLILNNVTFPKQEIMEYIKDEDTGELLINALNNIVPRGANLEIYGYVKDSPLKDLTTEQLDLLKQGRNINMPSSYKGPQDIYDRLKTYIYKGESKKTEFGNFTSSLNKKPQSPVFLALLQGKTDHTRG